MDDPVQSNTIYRDGIDRRAYIITIVALMMMLPIFMFVGYGFSSNLVFYGGVFAVYSATAFATALRIKSIGYSRWFAVLMFVPAVNFVTIICSSSLPPDFSRTRRLDKPAYVISIALVLIWFVPFVLSLR